MEAAIAATPYEAATRSGHVGRIPIRNLWLLMLYASDLFRSSGKGYVSLEENPDDLPDLVAEILAHAVEQRQRRRLSLGYQVRKTVMSRVRGRIDVLSTETNQLLARGLVACEFEELTVDTPRNRFVRSALEAIARIVRRADLAHRCRKLASDMKALGVSGNPPTRLQMTAYRFGRHDADDRFMIDAAKLAFDLALPTEVSGANILSLPDREERWARRLYEKAVGGFYNVVLSSRGWSIVQGRQLHWQIEQSTPGINDIMPTMRTDMILYHPGTGRQIVIDTKFNSLLTSGWYREQTLRSGYVYQMYAYLQSQVGRGDAAADQAEGLLLHPSIGETLDETVVIQGKSIRFATVDLSAPADDIRSRLLAFCDPMLVFATYPALE